MDSFAEIISKRIDEAILYRLGQRDGMEKGIEKGMEKGQEKKSFEVVQTLVLNTSHTVPEIAGLVNVSEDFVRKVKESLQS